MNPNTPEGSALYIRTYGGGNHCKPYNYDDLPNPANAADAVKAVDIAVGSSGGAADPQY